MKRRTAWLRILIRGCLLASSVALPSAGCMERPAQPATMTRPKEMPMSTLVLSDQTLQLQTIYEADFTGRAEEWISEGAPIRFADGRLYCDAREGERHFATIWCTRRFAGDAVIEYTMRSEVSQGPQGLGRNNLNFIVYATETDGRPVLETSDQRTGEYGEYHRLNNYIYTFLSGNPEDANDKPVRTRIRFRKDPGFNLVQEQWRDGHIVKGRDYAFTIVVQGPRMRFYVDGELVIDHEDDDRPHRSGHHAFRTWRTHVSSRRFAVSRIIGAEPR